MKIFFLLLTDCKEESDCKQLEDDSVHAEKVWRWGGHTNTGGSDR